MSLLNVINAFLTPVGRVRISELVCEVFADREKEECKDTIQKLLWTPSIPKKDKSSSKKL